MGVTSLWTIVEPAKQHIPLTILEGQTLAVDLSIWVMESNGVQGLQQVRKPYLRNLFFRVSNLLQLGVNLVFVTDGDAPDLKRQTMASRQQAVWGSPDKQTTTHFDNSRSHFSAKIKELVDACITNDSDSLLYGAETVYRNFTLDTKDPHVECYRMTDILKSTGFVREHLVAMALLLGCDYAQEGVKGIGKEKACRLVRELGARDILKRFQDWRCPSFKAACKLEDKMRARALKDDNFPNVEVIKEYMVTKEKCPSEINKWKRPNAQKIIKFLQMNLGWAELKAHERVLPLVTAWDLIDLVKKKQSTDQEHLKPKQILKTRTLHGRACYEVQWIRPSWSQNEALTWVTKEDQTIFLKCFPTLVMQFEQENQKQKPKGRKRKVQTEVISHKIDKYFTKKVRRVRQISGGENKAST